MCIEELCWNLEELEQLSPYFSIPGPLTSPCSFCPAWSQQRVGGTVCGPMTSKLRVTLELTHVGF